MGIYYKTNVIWENYERVGMMKKMWKGSNTIAVFLLLVLLIQVPSFAVTTIEKEESDLLKSLDGLYDMGILSLQDVQTENLEKLITQEEVKSIMKSLGEQLSYERKDFWYLTYFTRGLEVMENGYVYTYANGNYIDNDYTPIELVYIAYGEILSYSENYVKEVILPPSDVEIRDKADIAIRGLIKDGIIVVYTDEDLQVKDFMTKGDFYRTVYLVGEVLEQQILTRQAEEAEKADEGVVVGTPPKFKLDYPKAYKGKLEGEINIYTMLDEDCKVYYSAIPYGLQIDNDTFIKTITSTGKFLDYPSGTFFVKENRVTTETVTDLKTGKYYDIYIIAEDEDGNLSDLWVLSKTKSQI